MQPIEHDVPRPKGTSREILETALGATLRDLLGLGGFGALFPKVISWTHEPLGPMQVTNTNPTHHVAHTRDPDLRFGTGTSRASDFVTDDFGRLGLGSPHISQVFWKE